MFTGYSDQTVDFFWGIRLNNSREWFNPRKQEFQSCIQQPTKELAGELYDWFSEQYPDLHLNLHISRIYRDARRLFGRGPLKESMWFSFQNEQNSTDAPCFWFELGCEGYGFGFGYWADAAAALRYRRQIDNDPASMQALIDGFEKQDTFCLEGPDYKKSKGHVGEPVEAWYNKKWVSLACHRPYDPLSYSPALVDTLKEGFTFLVPYYRFFDRIYRSAD